MPVSPFDSLVLLLSPLYGAGEARSLARIVFEDVFHSRQYNSRNLNAQESQLLRGITERLLAGEPLQYILGEADFFGMKLEVNPAVLIPRQETEELVAWAIALPSGQSPVVLDIGTGSGCISIAFARKKPEAQITAIDISREALQLAERNARRYRVDIRFLYADILNPLKWPDGSFDMILSNPPYISPEEAVNMPKHVLAHEPHPALFASENDPLEFYKAIAKFALKRLNRGGVVLVEINEFRAAAVETIFKAAGFAHVEIRRDISGAERMVGAW